jgi:hypothetical protein
VRGDLAGEPGADVQRQRVEQMLARHAALVPARWSMYCS